MRQLIPRAGMRPEQRATKSRDCLCAVIVVWSLRHRGKITSGLTAMGSHITGLTSGVDGCVKASTSTILKRTDKSELNDIISVIC